MRTIIYAILVVAALSCTSSTAESPDRTTMPALQSTGDDSLLCEALWECDLAQVRSLLEKDADPNGLCDEDHLITLCAECEDNALAMTRLLLKFGADINGADADGTSLFQYAVFFHQPDLVDFLLTQPGVDLFSRDTVIGCSAIQLCQDLDMVKKLEKAGFDPNEVCGNGRTLLHYAARDDLRDIARYLIAEKGIDVSLRDGEGRTALDYALRQNNQEIARMLQK
jgi:ankyrin repeat protein